MIRSRSWDWDKVTDPKWERPAEEVYPVALRWKREGKRKVLDLGCGIGRHALFLAEMGFQVEAFDLSESGVARLKEASQARGLSIGVAVGGMLSLPFESNHFDGILAFHVIYHTDQTGIKLVMLEIRRVLAGDGEIFVTFNSKCNPSFADPNSKRVDENTIVTMDGDEEGIPHCYLDENEIRRLMSGFEITRLTHLEELTPGGQKWRYFVQARKISLH
ncbi:MAG: class I SAM-dependent methyltransferase [Firmicutes bacterium]|nr:class I SAM-dependent methyltransferase [Bacillota bacterium]